jgi:hypothetical protein
LQSETEKGEKKGLKSENIIKTAYETLAERLENFLTAKSSKVLEHYSRS